MVLMVGQLTALPKSLYELESLQELNILGNPIKEPLESLKKLEERGVRIYK